MAGTPAVPDMRLELVPLPVSDVDRARAFYEQAGFGNSVIPTAICGRFSSGQPVTRHSQEAGPPRRMPTLPQSRAARRGHRAGPARTGLTQSLFIQGVPS